MAAEAAPPGPKRAPETEKERSSQPCETVVVIDDSKGNGIATDISAAIREDQ